MPGGAGAYRAWLRAGGSLTQRIEARAPGMKVKVMFQGPRRLNRDERFMAPDNACATTLTRDVHLICGSTPVVYAHSVIQPGDRGAAARLMRRMGTRPLGAALFADPRIRRCALRFCRIGRGHELYRNAIVMLKRPPVALWARRSVFVIGKSPILVTEVFLPGIVKL